MTKDEAEAIHALARQLLEEDVSVERRCRLARKIIEHARAIKASCMAEPVTRTITVKVPPISAPTTTQKQIAKQIEAGIKRALQRMETRIEDAWAQPANFGAAPHVDPHPGFTPVRIKYADWWKAGPEHDGERIMWADGSLHSVPEHDSEYITVLRRVDMAVEYGTPIPFEWSENRQTTHVPANYG